MNKLSASIIVPSFHRPEGIQKILTMLSLLCEKEGAELLLVDQSGYDLQKIESITRNCDFKYVRLAEPNLPAARNAGAENSSGEILLFIDDDAEPQEGWIAAHLAPFADPQIGCVGGRVIDTNAKGNSKVPVTYNSRTGEYVADFGCDVAQETISFPGGNSAIRKKAWEQIRFDPIYKANAYFEEVDFAFRARKKGWKIFYEPKAAIIHQPSRTGGCRYEKFIEVYYRFRNFSLFYFRFNGIKNLFHYAKKEKNFAEFISRNPNGSHRIPIVATAFAGFFTGMILGLARRFSRI